MPGCVFRRCKNNSNTHSKKDGITFHLFPIDIKRKNLWADIIKKERAQDNWLPSRSTIVCSKHFDDSDMYITGNGLRRLKKEAVPKLVLPNVIVKENNDDCSYDPDKKNMVDMCSSKSYDIWKMGIADTNNSYFRIQPNKKAVSETPGEINLRKLLQKKIGYIQTYLKKIRSLNRKNILLKKNNMKLKSHVRTVKKKRFLNGLFECKCCRNLLDSDDT